MLILLPNHITSQTKMMIAMIPHQGRRQDETLGPLGVAMPVGAAGPRPGFGVAHLRVIPGYSPECVEKLFGKSDWVSNRDSEGRQEGVNLAAKDPRLRSLQLFSQQFRRVHSRNFALEAAPRDLAARTSG